MFTWSEKQIEYMENALPYTDYYDVIAREIAPFLRPTDHVCDAGCGLGCLGLALKKYCQEITCVDADPQAIASLCQRLEGGVHAVCGDIAQAAPTKPYDAMVFCLFGSLSSALAIAKAQCQRQLCIVKRNYGHHRFSTEPVPIGNYHAEATARELSVKGIPFTQKNFEASFDQPLHSLAEAKAFFSIYSRSDKEISLSELRAQLTEGPDKEFPYCLKNKKSLTLFTVNVKDIP